MIFFGLTFSRVWVVKFPEALYSSTSAHLSEDEVDQAFQVSAGVRHGGPESPSLCCLLMDWVMRIFTERAEKLGLHGVKLKYNIASAATNRSERAEHPMRSELNILWAGFADDIRLFFTSELDLEKGIKLLVEIYIYPKKNWNHDLERHTRRRILSEIDEPTTVEFEIEARINLAKKKHLSYEGHSCRHSTTCMCKHHNWPENVPNTNNSLQYEL